MFCMFVRIGLNFFRPSCYSLTEYFIIIEPQNPYRDVFYSVKKPGPPEFHLLKLRRNIRS